MLLEDVVLSLLFLKGTCSLLFGRSILCIAATVVSAVDPSDRLILKRGRFYLSDIVGLCLNRFGLLLVNFTSIMSNELSRPREN